MVARKSFKGASVTAQQREPINYSDAVELAKWYLQHVRFEDGLDLYDGKGDYQNTVARIAPMLLQHYPEYLNANEPLHRDILRNAFSQRIANNDPIPSNFRELAASFMTAESSEPRRKAGAKETAYLHSRIIWAVALLKHSGMTETRNDESKPLSACDAVAEALGQLGLKPSTFSRVKRIWLENRWLVAVARKFDDLSRHD